MENVSSLLNEYWLINFEFFSFVNIRIEGWFFRLFRQLLFWAPQLLTVIMSAIKKTLFQASLMAPNALVTSH